MSAMNPDTDSEASEHDARWPQWMRDWVLPYMRESALWPVLFAIAGHFVIVYALMLVSVWRDGWDGTWGWVAFSVASSSAPAIWELSLFKRPGAINLVVALTWISALIIAWIGIETGFI
ncbi:MAG: hypothetical protein KC912_12300 [Proteobacteria bacterium]|nr:hypothetical protein [Pseudomonadota bacterium]